MNKKKAFVLMPFAEELSDVYKYLIADSLKDAGYDVRRADDILSQNNILRDIIKGITYSDLIIADLTGANPNVYYELGIAHALNKKVILLTQDIDELPFDLRSYRVITYSIHFAKMNQAKEELLKIASETIKGNLPFGNPVKDFHQTSNTSIEEIGYNTSASESEDDGDYGFLDYQVKLEDGFTELSAIITGVGSKLGNEVTPKVTISGEKLNSGKYTTKQRRYIVRDLAKYLQEYGAFVKPNNEKYRILLNDIEKSLDFILGGKFEVDDSSEQELQEFVTVLTGVEESAFEGRKSFASLIETMDSLPKIEKTFNRANVFMSSELKEFVGNIDQTIAVISRATRLGKTLLEKNHNN